jgi:hypothetical protein
MTPVETIPETGGGEIKENSTMIYCKNICKCHNVLPGQQ